MIGKQNCDALYFCCIFEDSAVSHIFYKKMQLGGRGSVQKHKGAYSREGAGGVMKHEYTDNLNFFLLFFWVFLLGSLQILQTLRVKIYTDRFQELYHCCIHLRVFITLCQSNSEL